MAALLLRRLNESGGPLKQAAGSVMLAAHMKSPVAAVGDRHASAPVTGPSPEVLIAVAEVGRELAAAGELEARLGGALRVLERRLGAGRSVVYSSDSAARSLTLDAS